MKRIARQINLVEIAFKNNYNRTFVSTLKSIAQKLQKSKSAITRRDIEDSLSYHPEVRETDLFSKLRRLMKDLNSAPPEISQSPEAHRLLQKIIHLMSDHA